MLTLLLLQTAIAAQEPLLPDGPNLQVGGRFLQDFTFPSGGEATALALGIPLDDGAEVRAARIRIFGDLSPGIAYKMEYDWAGGDASLEDAFLRFACSDRSFLVVGHQDEPFGLDHMTSTRFVTFLERSSPVRTFAPDHNLGVSAWSHAAGWTAGGGVFRQTDSTGRSTDSGAAATARAVLRPRFQERGRRLLHLGMAASLRRPDAPVSYAARPENHFLPAFVNTGALDADEILLLGWEAAMQDGPFHGMAELTLADLSGPAGTAMDLSGWSVQGGWFLTGEHRGYDPELGSFDRVVPQTSLFDGQEGEGAWEVALRYSTLDLTEAGPVADEMESVSAALNWYPHKHVRVQLNLIRADLASLDATTTVALRFSFDF